MSKDADQTEVLGENPSTSSQPSPDAGGTKAASSREPCPEALVPVPDEELPDFVMEADHTRVPKASTSGVSGGF